MTGPGRGEQRSAFGVSKLKSVEEVGKGKNVSDAVGDDLDTAPTWWQ